MKVFILFENQAAACWKRRALFLTFAAALTGACGGDDGGKGPSGGADTGVSSPDGSMPTNIDAGHDAATNPAADASVDAKVDAGIDAASGDAGLDLATPGTDAPVLTKLAYFKADDLGPARILLSGRDQNGDVASYTIKFFKGTTPVSLLVMGDSFPPATEQTKLAAQPDPTLAPFFFEFAPSEDFVNNVDTIKVTVTDSGSRASAEVTATLGAPATASTTCDPEGFNRCSGSNVCVPSGKNYACMGITAARTAACASSSALVLSPPTVASVTGTLSSSSLWDTPAGCSSGDEKLNPDRIVKLHLAAAATKVTLSTDNPTTGFDTILYTINKCTDNSVACTVQPCPTCEDDDMSGSRTVLVLNSLAAGDYFIVVDSRPAAENTSTTFQLTATIN